LYEKEIVRWSTVHEGRGQ
jgi:hypothetical protein